MSEDTKTTQAPTLVRTHALFVYLFACLFVNLSVYLYLHSLTPLWECIFIYSRAARPARSINNTHDSYGNWWQYQSLGIASVVIYCALELLSSVSTIVGFEW